MINAIIQFIKRTPFLYNLAKKANRVLRENDNTPELKKEIIYYGYIMRDEAQLSAIIEDYNSIAKFDTRLFVLIDNPEYKLKIHQFIRENPEISFADLGYFERHRFKLSISKIVWINFTKEDRRLLEYLK
ncbi:MAG: hypothetical protein IKD04_09820 [Clostridia bacterium]|nr:hypothetical protein [Clostridia bacterium]